MNRSPLAVKLAEKKRELDNLQQLQQSSESLVKELEALKAKLETFTDGTEAVAAVMTNWQSVLKAVTLASSSVTRYSEEDENRQPETLVRIGIDQE
ncbi:DASH complex subunit Dad2p [Trichomonascus vanleenenianus]|uniref:Dad2p n=1 Tax=Trichomonascus vanleenenianus TaxID=2268995 RepID=UPI003ECA3426